MSDLYPLRLEPTLHPRVWGGHKLATLFNKPLPRADMRYGEAWELHDSSRVENGVLRGQSIATLLEKYGAELVGAGYDPTQGFPLLVKLLDASDWLSVQVHPNDEQAQRLEGDPRGKSEAWVILQADEGAQLVIGVQAGADKAMLRAAIAENRLEPLLVYADVRAGDVLSIPANTLHAIGAGIVLYEIQQSSDVTYRLYDWGRVGLDGTPRELHVEKGLEVAALDRLPELTHPEGDGALLVRSPYFLTVQHILDHNTLELRTGGQFQALTCVEGNITVTHDETTIYLATGATALVPACLDVVMLVGTGRVLRSCPPPQDEA